MKIKTIFILLNIVIFALILLCFFSFFSILPFSDVGKSTDGTSTFFFVSAVACIILLAILVCADIFLLRRAKMLDALMSENWPALASFFESEILEKGRFSRRWTVLFINVLVLLSDYETLRALFLRMKSEKPDLYRFFAPDFIAASVVFGNMDEAESCISIVRREVSAIKSEEREWAEFYSAFIDFRNGKYLPASEQFAHLADSTGNPVIRAVSAYFCGKLIPAKTFGIGVSTKTLYEASNAAREKTLATFSRKSWQELCKKTRKQVRAAIIGKTINSATKWLFPEENQAAE